MQKKSLRSSIMCWALNNIYFKNQICLSSACAPPTHTFRCELERSTVVCSFCKEWHWLVNQVSILNMKCSCTSTELKLGPVFPTSHMVPLQIGILVQVASKKPTRLNSSLVFWKGLWGDPVCVLHKCSMSLYDLKSKILLWWFFWNFLKIVILARGRGYQNKNTAHVSTHSFASINSHTISN